MDNEYTPTAERGMKRAVSFVFAVLATTALLLALGACSKPAHQPDYGAFVEQVEYLTQTDDYDRAALIEYGKKVCETLSDEDYEYLIQVAVMADLDPWLFGAVVSSATTHLCPENKHKVE